MPRFAANLGYLFTDRPLLERIDAAAAAGFKAVELQFPYDIPASAVKAAIERNKLTILGLNTPPGERDGEFGLAAVPGREKDWQVLFARALDYASAIGASAIHCLAGKVAPEQRPAADRVFIDNLTRAADLAAAKNITLLIEPINGRDRPNYFLNHVEHAADIIGKIGKAKYPHAVRFLSRADRRRRFDLPARKTSCRSSAICNAPPCPHVTSRTKARSTIPRCSKLWTARLPGWIGAEYRPRARTEDGLGWARKYGVVPCPVTAD